MGTCGREWPVLGLNLSQSNVLLLDGRPVTSQTVEVLYFTTVCDSKKDMMIENAGES